MIELRPEKEAEYRQLHAEVWPEVKAAIRRSHIRNFNIYVTTLRGHRYLVSHFDYTGSNPQKDFAAMAQDRTTREKWWPLTDACQQVLEGTPKGQQWLPLEQVMHLD
jgi:L-rhamnose mutarotase